MAVTDNAVPETDGSAADAPVEKKKGRLGIMLVTVVLLAALGGGAAVSFSQYDRIARAAATLLPASDSSEVEQAPPTFGAFYEIDNMIVNPADTDGRRYLMINIGLESANEEVVAELEQKEIVIRDLLLRRLGARSVPELSDVSLRSEIKAELRDSVNVLLEGDVTRLYFTQFVLQ